MPPKQKKQPLKKRAKKGDLEEFKISYRYKGKPRKQVRINKKAQVKLTDFSKPVADAEGDKILQQAINRRSNPPSAKPTVNAVPYDINPQALELNKARIEARIQMANTARLEAEQKQKQQQQQTQSQQQTASANIAPIITTNITVPEAKETVRAIKQKVTRARATGQTTKAQQLEAQIKPLEAVLKKYEEVKKSYDGLDTFLKRSKNFKAILENWEKFPNAITEADMSNFVHRMNVLYKTWKDEGLTKELFLRGLANIPKDRPLSFSGDLLPLYDSLNNELTTSTGQSIGLPLERTGQPTPKRTTEVKEPKLPPLRAKRGQTTEPKPAKQEEIAIDRRKEDYQQYLKVTKERDKYKEANGLLQRMKDYPKEFKEKGDKGYMVLTDEAKEAKREAEAIVRNYNAKGYRELQKKLQEQYPEFRESVYLTVPQQPVIITQTQSQSQSQSQKQKTKTDVESKVDIEADIGMPAGYGSPYEAFKKTLQDNFNLEQIKALLKGKDTVEVEDYKLLKQEYDRIKKDFDNLTPDERRLILLQIVEESEPQPSPPMPQPSQEEEILIAPEMTVQGSGKKKLKSILKKFAKASKKGGNEEELQQLEEDAVMQPDSEPVRTERLASDYQMLKPAGEQDKAFRLDVFKEKLPEYAPPVIRNMLKDWGDAVVIKCRVCREPINSAIQKVGNLLTLGKLEKNRQLLGYDNLFHLYVDLAVKKPNGQIGVWRIEKNQKVDAQLVKGGVMRKWGKCIDQPPTAKVTLNEMFSKAERRVGGNQLWVYDLRNNNCQRFVLDLLGANGFLKPDARQFILQRPSELLPPILLSMTRGVTDFANRLKSFFSGKGLVE